MLENGEIATSQSLRLGSIRLQEMFSTSEESPQRSADLLRQHISNALATLQSAAAGTRSTRSWPSAATPASPPAKSARPTESADLVVIDPAEFDKLVDRCERYTAEELSKRHGLPFAEAETLNPALLVYQSLLQQDEGRADDRLARLDARRPVAGTGPRGHRQGGRGRAGRA